MARRLFMDRQRALTGAAPLDGLAGEAKGS